MSFTHGDALDVALLRQSLGPISFSNHGYPKPVQDYFQFYGLDYPAAAHFFGTFRSGPYTLAGHVYKPDSSRGTVFLAHGLFDHTGILKNLIALCIREKLCVAAFDLPGHGLSSGAPAAIDSFGEYKTALEDFVSLCAPHVPKPYAAVGHSTGCAVILTHLFYNRQTPFSRVVLLAPLVHSEFWDLSKAGHALMPFVSAWPRWMREASHDTAFLAWFDRDPLQSKTFPVKWATAMYRWEAGLDSVAPLHLPVTIVQGTGDDCVDWNYNIPFLQKKIPGCDIRMVKEARHQLLNEAQPWKTECLDIVREALSGLPRPQSPVKESR
ncbi:MAG TPA: alpha/beta hydrolase [Chitinivibrionales bacterium]|nr:alpha/beta hydrolase [Chitinivibrionales bacterium]